MHGSRPAGVVLATAFALAVLGPAAAAAQSSAWRVKGAVRADVRHDDNPFLLTGARKAVLDQPSTADSTSGRFRDMASATDLIPAPAVELRVVGPGLAGNELGFEIEAVYEANVANARRRHAETTVTVEQSLGADRLRLRAGWRPSYFSKNYLTDAVDVNPDGEITADERRYASGVSNELDVWLSYRHRFAKATTRRPLGVALALGLGYLDRAFRAPFPGRTRSGPGAEAGVTVELGRRWTLDLDYAYASLRADPTREVLILDEPEFGRDFNSNGTTTELDARAFELVDRSRTEHAIDIAVQGQPAKKVRAELVYGRRMRSFSSTQPFDVAGRARDDTQDEIATELSVTVTKQVELALSARRITQSTNRPADPGATGDVADYTRHVAGAALRYRF